MSLFMSILALGVSGAVARQHIKNWARDYLDEKAEEERRKKAKREQDLEDKIWMAAFGRKRRPED